MLNIPILRHGQPYTSIDTFDIVHHATGQPVARISQANPGLISRDIARMDYDVLEQFRMRELIDVCKKAAKIFMTADLPIGDSPQSFDDYIRHLSASVTRRTESARPCRARPCSERPSTPTPSACADT